MRIRAGGRVEQHIHRRAHHHVWVVDGTVHLLGAALGPGSYAHIPAGVAHELTVDEVESDVMFFYVYEVPGSGS